jgi:transposase-like protein
VADEPDTKSISPHVRTKLLSDSTVYAETALAYDKLGKIGDHHNQVQHAQKAYVSSDFYTNAIEGFWAYLKSSVNDVYRRVFSKHLQAFDGYIFRYYKRDDTGGMVNAFLDRVEKASPEFPS